MDQSNFRVCCDLELTGSDHTCRSDSYRESGRICSDDTHHEIIQPIKLFMVAMVTRLGLNSFLAAHYIVTP